MFAFKILVKHQNSTDSQDVASTVRLKLLEKTCEFDLMKKQLS